ncbi:MAG: DUF2510 domain-containing protein [Nitriliruptoraceae bacterium]
MPTAGWYDDPQGGGGQRWWDGERWTEHIVPPPPPGAAGATAVAGAASSTPAETGSGGGKTALIVVLVVAVLLLVVVGGIAAVFGLRSGLTGMFDIARSGSGITVEQSDGGSITGDAPAPAPNDRLDGEVTAGHQRSFEVSSGGSWVLEFEAPDGLLVIDVRGQEGFDPVAHLEDADTGRVIARNDDRDADGRARYGGGTFDALLEVEVEAGRYRLVVDGFAGGGGPGVVAFPVVGE